MRQVTNNDLRLMIERIAGEWQIRMSSGHKGQLVTGHGVGKTFSEAWENLGPSWR
jgi:hypothetical protein